MYTLSISSASSVISVAISNPTKDLLAEFSVAYKNSRVEDLVSFIKDVADKAKIDIKDIGQVLVAIGPGSYTGLRGGAAAAKTIAQTLKCPIIPVSTLEAMAFAIGQHLGAFAVVMDAKKDEYNLALFSRDGSGKISRLTQDSVISTEQFAKFLLKFSAPFIVLTNLSGFPNNILSSNKKIQFVFGVLPFAKYVFEAARQKEGKQQDPLSLKINYLHSPNIRTFKKA